MSFPQLRWPIVAVTRPRRTASMAHRCGSPRGYTRFAVAAGQFAVAAAARVPWRRPGAGELPVLRVAGAAAATGSAPRRTPVTDPDPQAPAPSAPPHRYNHEISARAATLGHGCRQPGPPDRDDVPWVRLFLRGGCLTEPGARAQPADRQAVCPLMPGFPESAAEVDTRLGRRKRGPNAVSIPPESPPQLQPADDSPSPRHPSERAAPMSHRCGHQRGRHFGRDPASSAPGFPIGRKVASSDHIDH